MTIQFDVVRPDDLLNLHLRGVNLRLNSDDPKYPILEVEETQRPAYLIVTFPPQTIAEDVYKRQVQYLVTLNIAICS